jgi:hypothetical protein
MKLKFQISPKSYEKICVRICEKLKKKCYVQDNINKSKLIEGGTVPYQQMSHGGGKGII